MAAEQAAARQTMKQAERYGPAKEVHLDGAPILAVTGVYYKCPMIGPDVLLKKDMEARINQFLLSQLAEEPEMTSALMMHTLNKDPEKVKLCIETLCKYLENIIQHPGEEKYTKIRINNKVFQEKVSSLEGTDEFLQAAGFASKLMPGPSQVEEPFYVLGLEQSQDTDRLVALREVLLAAEPIKPELDRNVQVFRPSQHASRIQVPEEFYSVSPEELKKEQQMKQEAVDRLGMLRTKEMRERERQRELRRYRFTLIRIRFPDGVILQGTFRAKEKLQQLIDFIRENLELDWIPFGLSSATGQKMNEFTSSFAELDLAPAALLNFAFDPQILAEMTAQAGSHKIDRYLKQDVYARMTAMS